MFSIFHEEQGPAMDISELDRLLHAAEEELMVFEDLGPEPDEPLANFVGTAPGAQPMSSGNDQARTLRKFSPVTDSGSSDHVTSKSAFPELQVTPSEKSMRGHVYGAAGGKGIPNEGELYIPLRTMDGWKAGQLYQVAEVRRPLCSIAKLCDNGNRVLFGRGGGIVQNLRNGHCTPFRREGSIYVMDLYVDVDAPFRGPG